MSEGSVPKRGDIWVVNLDPTVGSEIQKKRPCAVIGLQDYMTLSRTIIAPITEWKPKYSKVVWMIRITADSRSGLKKDSAADASQVRSVSSERLIYRLGKLSSSQLEDTVAGVVLCIGYES